MTYPFLSPDLPLVKNEKNKAKTTETAWAKMDWDGVQKVSFDPKIICKKLAPTADFMKVNNRFHQKAPF